MSLNKTIDKAQSEASAIQQNGIKKYIWSREVKFSLGVLLVIVGVSFLLGAIVFWFLTE